jgi:hypothetical protein
MAEQEGRDRRRYPRLEFGIRVFEEKDWMIRDLNPLGCFIETANPLPIDSEVDIKFQIPMESQYIPIVAKGIVRRETPAGMAIEFIELESKYYTYLEEFVMTYS